MPSRRTSSSRYHTTKSSTATSDYSSDTCTDTLARSSSSWGENSDSGTNGTLKEASTGTWQKNNPTSSSSYGLKISTSCTVQNWPCTSWTLKEMGSNGWTLRIGKRAS